MLKRRCLYLSYFRYCLKEYLKEQKVYHFYANLSNHKCGQLEHLNCLDKTSKVKCKNYKKNTWLNNLFLKIYLIWRWKKEHK